MSLGSILGLYAWEYHPHDVLRVFAGETGYVSEETVETLEQAYQTFLKTGQQTLTTPGVRGRTPLTISTQGTINVDGGFYQRIGTKEYLAGAGNGLVVLTSEILGGLNDLVKKACEDECKINE